jgi:hypothetical protein
MFCTRIGQPKDTTPVNPYMSHPGDQPGEKNQERHWQRRRELLEFTESQALSCWRGQEGASQGREGEVNHARHRNKGAKNSTTTNIRSTLTATDEQNDPTDQHRYHLL